MKKLKLKQWLYALIIVGVVLLVAVLIWVNNHYALFGEIFGESNAPLIWRLTQ